MNLRDLFSQEEMKAGMIPYFIEDGVVNMLFMIPSDPHYGGDCPNIGKGTIDQGESDKEAAFREAAEELGLKLENVNPYSVKLAWKGISTGMDDSYLMSIYVCEVYDKNNFDKPHFETKETVWLTEKEFKNIGRSGHREIVSTAGKVIALCLKSS